MVGELKALVTDGAFTGAFPLLKEANKKASECFLGASLAELQRLG